MPRKRAKQEVRQLSIFEVQREEPSKAPPRSHGQKKKGELSKTAKQHKKSEKTGFPLHNNIDVKEEKKTTAKGEVRQAKEQTKEGAAGAESHLEAEITTIEDDSFPSEKISPDSFVTVYEVKGTDDFPPDTYYSPLLSGLLYVFSGPEGSKIEFLNEDGTTEIQELSQKTILEPLKPFRLILSKDFKGILIWNGNNQYVQILVKKKVKKKLQGKPVVQTGKISHLSEQQKTEKTQSDSMTFQSIKRELELEEIPDEEAWNTLFSEQDSGNEETYVLESSLSQKEILDFHEEFGLGVLEDYRTLQNEQEILEREIKEQLSQSKLYSLKHIKSIHKKLSRELKKVLEKARSYGI